MYRKQVDLYYKSTSRISRYFEGFFMNLFSKIYNNLDYKSKKAKKVFEVFDSSSPTYRRDYSHTYTDIGKQGSDLQVTRFIKNIKYLLILAFYYLIGQFTSCPIK